MLAALTACHRHAPAAAGTPARASSAVVASANALPADITPAMVAQGDSLFNNGSCMRCHARGGAGGQNGPTLTDSTWLQISGRFDEIVKVIADGVPAPAIKNATHRFPMNPRGGPMNLTDAQIRSVAAYVFTLARR
jgi:mono/diheme cytochrome c family protein